MTKSADQSGIDATAIASAWVKMETDIAAKDARIAELEEKLAKVERSLPGALQAISVEDAAKRLGVHEVTLRRWGKDGTIKVARVAGRVLVPLSEVERVLRAEG